MPVTCQQFFILCTIDCHLNSPLFFGVDANWNCRGDGAESIAGGRDDTDTSYAISCLLGREDGGGQQPVHAWGAQQCLPALVQKPYIEPLVSPGRRFQIDFLAQSRPIVWPVMEDAPDDVYLVSQKQIRVPVQLRDQRPVQAPDCQPKNGKACHGVPNREPRRQGGETRAHQLVLGLQYISGAAHRADEFTLKRVIYFCADRK